MKRKLLLIRRPKCLPVLIVLVCLLFGFSGCSEAGEEAGSSQQGGTERIVFKHLVSRNLRSDEVPAQKVIFTTQQSWSHFWNQHSSGDIPEVNFIHDMVAAIFLGGKPNSGYGLEILKIEKKAGNQIQVGFVEYLPNPELNYAAVVVYSYDIVVFTKVEGKIMFEGTQEIK